MLLRIAKYIALSVLCGLFFENSCLAQKWTLLFYMAADNDLNDQARLDIAQLTKVADIAGINIVLQLDSPAGASRYKINSQGTQLLAWLGEVNSGSAQPLADFGEWAAKLYPANNYMLVLWDHGSGWSKEAKSIGYDLHHDDYLSVSNKELRRAVESISKSIGQPIDIIVFDACSMQMAEVLLELKGLCNYAVGSQALFPEEGVPYEIALGGITGNIGADSLAKTIVKSCQQYYAFGPAITFSAVDVNKLSLWAVKMAGYMVDLKNINVASFISPGSISDTVLSFYPSNSYDLGGILNVLAAKLPEPYRSNSIALKFSLDSCVIKSVFIGAEYSKATGISVWYPGSGYSFWSLSRSYNNLAWPRDSRWDRFIFSTLDLKDTTVDVPQNVVAFQPSGENGLLRWDDVYDISGLVGYQVRSLSSLNWLFQDNANIADTGNWQKSGFVWKEIEDGNGEYFAKQGQLLSKTAIETDLVGGVLFSARGRDGLLRVETSEDTTIEWEIVYAENYFSDTAYKYQSVNINSGHHWIKFSWVPYNVLSWVCLDGIRSLKAAVILEESVPPNIAEYSLKSNNSNNYFYQVRALDSLGQASSWSNVANYSPTAKNHVKVWPNPSNNKFNLTWATTSGQNISVLIYNITGQLVAQMKQNGTPSVKKEELTNYSFVWEGADFSNRALSSGVYIYKAISDKSELTGKIIYIK